MFDAVKRGADPFGQYKDKGDESGLHIIIFDELDAVFKQRGSTNTGTGVGDTVVNQLLSKVSQTTTSLQLTHDDMHRRWTVSTNLTTSSSSV